MFLTNKGQAATAVLAIIGVVVVGLLIWWAFTADNNVDVDIDEGTNGDQETVEIPEGWEVYSSEALNFSMAHPQEVTVGQETAGRVQFQYVGPDSEAGTEITDGYTITVANENTQGFISLRAYVDAQYEEYESQGLGVQAPEATTFHDREAYAFVVESQLGTQVEHMYIDHGPGVTLHLSWSVQDPNEQGYAAIVDTMRSTLNIRTDGRGVGLFSRVNIAVLNTEPDGEPERGCDDVVLVERQVAQTTQPLNAALTELFSIEDEQVSGYYNFIARTNDTLTFERATVSADGTANIYLSGEASGYQGVCDNPRAAIQIEETAMQFGTVNNVQIWLNGTTTNLQPDMRGDASNE